VTIVICGRADITDGRLACDTVDVQLLVVVPCAGAFLLWDGLLALLEIINGLQGRRRVLADSERRLLVGSEAVMAQEHVAPLAVVRSIVTRTL